VVQPAIVNLPALVEALPAEDRLRFKRIFHLAAADGLCVPPQDMNPWIESYFGSVEAVRTQHIVRVTNRLTFEGALFNTLRASRPIDGSGGTAAQDVEATIRATEGDAFCHPLTGTPADVFGRARGRHALTAANIAKADAWHSVIVYDEHHPLRFDAGRVADYVETAQEWARLAHQADPQARYPLFMWNCLWRGGASILHGHAQMVLTRGMHFGRVEAWRQAAARHHAAYGTDYFADVAAVMRALGLAVDRGTVVLYPTLTPCKEKEVQIVAPRLDDDLTAAIYHVLRTLIDRLDTRSFNLALYQPPLGPRSDQAEDDWEGFPFIVRLVDRGSLHVGTSDIGAMELFAQSVITADPFRVADALRQA